MFAVYVSFKVRKQLNEGKYAEVALKCKRGDLLSLICKRVLFRSKTLRSANNKDVRGGNKP